MSTALDAAYTAIRSRLTASDEMWGGNVRVSVAKAGTPYPYVVQFWSGGGERNQRRKRDAELVIGVKCVSDVFDEAITGAARIEALLNDKGFQDDPDAYLIGTADWDILTSTQETAIYLADEFAGAKTIYHVGAFYRLVLETTS